MASPAKPARAHQHHGGSGFVDVTPSKPNSQSESDEPVAVAKEYAAAESVEGEKPQFHPDFNTRLSIISAYCDYFNPTAVKFFFTNLFTTDMKAGIAVAFISLPLSTALSIASGGTPMMGLATAFFGPFTQGMLGGSQFNILGPAGALINIIQNLVYKCGTTAVIPPVAFLSGIFSLLAAKCGVAKHFMRIEHEYAILEGFSL